jgi:HEAT repeat protein
MSAEFVVKTLIQGRQAERMDAQRALERDDEGVNRDLARRLILDALNGPCTPLPVDRREDDTHAGARCWLLGSLAWVPADDNEPDSTLRRFSQVKNEWNWWARYWAVQALHLRKSADLQQFVRQHVVDTDDDVLPRSLGLAILAEAGDTKAIQEIKGTLEDDSGSADSEAALWGVLRALRFVYLPFAVNHVCRIVERAASKNIFSDTTFDAIVALGRIREGGKEASQAANALMNIIIHAREYEFWDVMRIRAIEALAKLRVPHTASLLLDEITDLNPSVVKAAAQALQPVLGAEMTATRILERLRQDEDPELRLPLYASALRFLEDRTAAVNRMETAMVSGPSESRDYARRLLSEMGGSYAVDKLTASARGAEHYLDVLDRADNRLREMFEETLQEGQRGFRIVIKMDITLFVTGLVLLGLAILAALRDEALISMLTASGGILSVLYGRFFAKPRQQVEASVTHLSTLKTIFLGYLRQLHQIDQAYARRMLEDEPPDANEAEQFTVLVQKVMGKALEELGSHESLNRVDRSSAPT